jgi:hypothetical protein
MLAMDEHVASSVLMPHTEAIYFIFHLGSRPNRLIDVLSLFMFRYLGTTITNQNLIQEEIKRRLNSGNACYHSVQNFWSSRLLSKTIKIRI